MSQVPLDIFTLGIAAASFILFFLLHVLLLRRNRQATSQMILISFFFGFVATMIAFLCLYVFGAQTDSRAALDCLVAALASAFLYALFFIQYIAWVFGMGEAAVRIRLLVEVGLSGKRGVSLAEIYTVYNAKNIMQTRMSRLVSANHLSMEGETYRMKSGILILQLNITRILRCVLGLNPKMSAQTNAFK
jgi:hypothetical protein